MAPIIHKNLETHGLKNMKANLMYSIVITFLVFTQCNFRQNLIYLEQMGSLMFGSDITIQAMSFSGSFYYLSEMPIREALEPHLVKNGGKVASFALQASNIVQSQLFKPGAEKLSEFATLTGLEKGFSYLPKLDLIGVEPQAIESLKHLAFYPGEIMEQPFG